MRTGNSRTAMSGCTFYPSRLGSRIFNNNMQLALAVDLWSRTAGKFDQRSGLLRFRKLLHFLELGIRFLFAVL